MTIDQAIEKLKEIYKQGEASPYVRTPVVWALYKTWRWADADEKRRRKRENEQSGNA